MRERILPSPADKQCGSTPPNAAPNCQPEPLLYHTGFGSGVSYHATSVSGAIGCTITKYSALACSVMFSLSLTMVSAGGKPQGRFVTVQLSSMFPGNPSGAPGASCAKEMITPLVPLLQPRGRLMLPSSTAPRLEFTVKNWAISRSVAGPQSVVVVPEMHHRLVGPTKPAEGASGTKFEKMTWARPGTAHKARASHKTPVHPPRRKCRISCLTLVSRAGRRSQLRPSIASI
jgi:hypothetical protein